MKREVIEFQSFTSSSSASGFITDTPVSYWITRAEVKPLSEQDNRKTEGFQTILQTGFTFKMRYRSDKTVTKSMTLLYKGQSYTIHGIENVKEENKELKVTALGSV